MMRRKTKNFLVKAVPLAALFFWCLVLIVLPGLMFTMVALGVR